MITLNLNFLNIMNFSTDFDQVMVLSRSFLKQRKKFMEKEKSKWKMRNEKWKGNSRFRLFTLLLYEE